MPVEGGQRGGQFGHGPTAKRDSTMTARPAESEACRASLFFSGLDGIESFSAKGQARAAKFTQSIVDPFKQISMLFNQEFRAIFAGSFFIDSGSENYIAGEADTFGFGFQDGSQVHSNAMLHIQSAATPDGAIHEAALEGRMGPLLAHGGDHVHMTVEHERGSIAIAFQAGYQVGTLGGARNQDGLKASLLEQAIDIFNAGAFVAGRVGGVEADQVLEQFSGPLVDGGAANRHALLQGDVGH
jgi:hypothetical protein